MFFSSKSGNQSLFFSSFLSFLLNLSFYLGALTEAKTRKPRDEATSKRQVGLSIHRSDDIGMLWGVDGSQDFTRKFCSVVISCEVSLGLERWREKLTLVKQYLTTHQKAPSQHSTNTDTKTLSSWISNQKQNYKKNSRIMSNPAIRREWELTLANPAYGPYIKPKDNKQDWRDQLVFVKQYLTTHKQSPSHASEDPDTKALAAWIGTQKQNYLKNAQIMSNLSIRHEWESTLADPAYGSYLQTNEQVWHDQLTLVKQYLTTHQQSPSQTSKTPDTKTLGKWIGKQKQNYTRNAYIMSNPAIRQEWENTLEDPAYMSFLKTRDNEQDWCNQLERVRKYLTTHRQASSHHSKNPDTKALAYWISNQQTNVEKNAQIMSNPAIRQEWESTLEDPAYMSFLKTRDNEQDWCDQLSLVKEYLTTHQQAHSQRSKNTDTKTLGKWISHQKQNYTTNAGIMSNPAIRQAWENALADPAYGSYLKPMDNEQVWRDQLDLVKQYLTTHQQSPSRTSKNPDTKALGSWIGSQKKNYAKNAQIISNPAIRQEWESTLANHAYGPYLVHPKIKSALSAPIVDPATEPPSPPKKTKLVHPPKAYADLTEEERRRICELHLRQKAPGYQTTNPDTKDRINNVWADSCAQGTVIFLDHIEFRTAYALLARGVLPENMLIPQRAEHFFVMSQHELFGSSVVLAEFNDAVASCLAEGTLLAGVYADYCCTLEKAALPLLQLLSSSKLQPGFVLGVTITLRNPEGVRFAGQDITTMERMLTKNWPQSSNLLHLAGVTPDDNGPLTYGVGAPMATWLLRL